MIRARHPRATKHEPMTRQTSGLHSRATLLALALFLTSTAFADDYRWEVKGRFDRDQAPGPFGDVDGVNLVGTWYFEPVSTDGVPLAEAAFLGRASRLSAAVARFEILDEGLNVQGANVGYYIPDTMFYAGAGVSRGQTITAINSSVVLKEYDTTWFGTLGVTPLDGLLVTTNFDEDGYDPNVTARYVGKLPNAHFYAGSVGLVDPDQGDLSFEIDFDYFIDESTSLGAGYTDAGDRWEVRAEKFFSNTWAAGVTAHTSDFSDGFGVHVTWRH